MRYQPEGWYNVALFSSMVPITDRAYRLRRRIIKAIHQILILLRKGHDFRPIDEIIRLQIKYLWGQYELASRHSADIY